uniref:Uncharacterized protein n=1 Tax=Ditylenchus dipsaci TaxID=166011 RepID=A0A915E520_9BILA
MGNATVISSSRNANGCSTQTITCQGTYTSTVSHIGVNYAGESAPTTVSDSSDGGTPQITVVCDRVDSWTYNGKKISDEFECSQSPASTTQPSTTTPKPTIPSTTPVPTTKTTTPASTTQTSTSTPKPTTASTTPVPTTKATTPAPTTTKASTPAPTTTKGTTTPTTSACPPGGKWSDWSNGTSCTDTCGSCGTTTKSRTCESEKNGCPCSGSPTSQESCGNAPCKYPRTSCCSPYKAAAVKSTISCTGSVTTTPAPTTKASSIGPSATTSASSASSSTKSGSSSASSTGTTLSGATCPPGGTWSEWTSPTNCNDTCGNCGYVTITRTCTSEKSGCPCEGSASAEECCNPTPSTTCGIDGANSTTSTPTTKSASTPTLVPLLLLVPLHPHPQLVPQLHYSQLWELLPRQWSVVQLEVGDSLH